MDQRSAPPPEDEGRAGPLVIVRRETADGEEFQSASVTPTRGGRLEMVLRHFKSPDVQRERLPTNQEQARSLVAERLRGLGQEGWRPVNAQQRERQQQQRERER